MLVQINSHHPADCTLQKHQLLLLLLLLLLTTFWFWLNGLFFQTSFQVSPGPLKISQTKTLQDFFGRPDAIPVTQTTASKH